MWLTPLCLQRISQAVESEGEYVAKELRVGSVKKYVARQH